MRVEKDENEETQKAQPRLQRWVGIGGRPRATASGAQLWRKELRTAENSRARWPSYETADVAKPTTVIMSGFFLGLVKRTWAAATGYMTGMKTPEE